MYVNVSFPPFSALVIGASSTDRLLTAVFMGVDMLGRLNETVGQRQLSRDGKKVQ